MHPLLRPVISESLKASRKIGESTAFASTKQSMGYGKPHWHGEGSLLWLYIHVDDIAIFGKEVDLFKRQIAEEFKIKDIGPVDLMLGVKITQKEESITLYQQHFAKSLLELYGMGSS
ncbi:hypothetical protein O181_044596 [Austropuccinia psidii MF-1]|uniref:Reverse transcriptase Ty1/copia-type domain-containing protein n=1 Tax=Austropuccinia psidii MF-1 TaxID=1389203 RepID=A0A9Q3HH05_9BASI|nr:hypothetical protein [Austropuccinia psidii MF-1]